MIMYQWTLSPIVFGFFILSLIINEANAALPGLSATTIDEYHVYLNWTAPSPPKNKIIIDYEVRFKEFNEANYITFNDGVSLNPYTTVNDLKKGTNYDFQVRALLSPSGRSNVGETSASTPKTDPTSTPEPPKISGVGFYSISITNSEKPYTQSESYTKKPNTRFEDFFPYSKFTNQLHLRKISI